MEFCISCQKVVGVRKDLTGCYIDPDTDEESVYFSYRCMECGNFIKNGLETNINKVARAVREYKK